jgi:hypothetical protein
MRTPAEVDKAREDYMSAFAETFPTLRNRPGVRPWDPILLAKQLKSAGVTNASYHAIMFVLGVWSTTFGTRDVDLCTTPFNIHAALQSWDDLHMKAFQAWVRDPWWM